MGSALPLSSCVPAELEDDRRLRRALRRLPDENGARFGCRLDARRRVDEVAGDHALPLGAERDRGLAGEHAGACRELGRSDLVAERRHGCDEVERGATARSASSSCAIGVPQTAMTASPMNFSTVPP